MSDIQAIDFQQGLSDAWSSVATVVPKFLVFIVILVVGFIIAKVVAKLIGKLLDRVGFDRVVDKSGISRAMESSNFDATTVLTKIVYYAVLLLTLQLAFGVWGPNPISDILAGIVAWLPRAFVALLIIVIGGAIARAVKDIVVSTFGGLSYGKLLGTIASVFIWGIVIVAALSQAGIATTVTGPVLIAVLATVGGIAVVGVGGGLVRPMQNRWDQWLARLDQEMPQMRAHADARRQASAGRTQIPADSATTAYGTSEPYGGGQAPQAGYGQGQPQYGDQPTSQVPYRGGQTSQNPQTPYGGGQPPQPPQSPQDPYGRGSTI